MPRAVLASGGTAVNKSDKSLAFEGLMYSWDEREISKMKFQGSDKYYGEKESRTEKEVGIEWGEC